MDPVVAAVQAAEAAATSTCQPTRLPSTILPDIREQLLMLPEVAPNANLSSSQLMVAVPAAFSIQTLRREFAATAAAMSLDFSDVTRQEVNQVLHESSTRVKRVLAAGGADVGQLMAEEQEAAEGLAEEAADVLEDALGELSEAGEW